MRVCLAEQFCVSCLSVSYFYFSLCGCSAIVYLMFLRFCHDYWLIAKVMWLGFIPVYLLTTSFIWTNACLWKYTREVTSCSSCIICVLYACFSVFILCMFMRLCDCIQMRVCADTEHLCIFKQALVVKEPVRLTGLSRNRSETRRKFCLFRLLPVPLWQIFFWL